MIPKKPVLGLDPRMDTDFRKRSRSSAIRHDPEKFFGQDHAQMQLSTQITGAIIVTIAAAALPAVQIRRAKCPR
jgi:hypothetical protein